MTIAQALSQASKAQGWSMTRIAHECGVGESAVRKWLIGSAIPRGDKMLILQRSLPGFAELLDHVEVKHAG